MKKVILKQNNKVIGVEELNDDHIIGIEYADIKSIVFKINDNLYASCSLFERNSNYDSIVEYTSIQQLILDGYCLNAFVFDSFEDRIKWLTNK